MKPTSPKVTLGRTPNGKSAPSADIKRNWGRYKISAAVAGVLLLTWYCWPNAQMAKVKQMQQELFAAEKLSPDEKKQKFEALRSEQKKLSPAEQKEVRKDMGEMFQQKTNAEAVKYLTLSPAARLKVVNEQIAREQAMQKKQAAAGPKGGGPGVGPAGGGPAGAGPGGGPAGAGGRTPPSPENRDAMRRESLIHTSAEARAGRDQMKLDIALRRAQLGLPPSANRGR
jgi:hypothetical protein